MKLEIIKTRYVIKDTDNNEIISYHKYKKHAKKKLKEVEASKPTIVEEVTEKISKSSAVPTNEIHLNVTWHLEIDTSEGKYPPETSGQPGLSGTSKDSILLSKYVFVRGKIDHIERRRYEKFVFLAPKKSVEGKTLFINGNKIGKIQINHVPSTEWTLGYAKNLPKEYISDYCVEQPCVRELDPDWVDKVYKSLGLKIRNRRY